MRRPLVLTVALVALAACAGERGGDPPAPSSASSGAVAAPQVVTSPEALARIRALLEAEHRREASAVTKDDQQHRDPLVRRAAARTLARIGGEAALAGLLASLRDEDREVVAWSAYGLGFSCTTKRAAPDAPDAAKITSALSARALSLMSEAPDAAARLDPLNATYRAIAACNTDRAESILASWLASAPDQAARAAMALGDLAPARKVFVEETLVALLQLAAGGASSTPAPQGLYAFGRLDRVPPSVAPRLLEVGRATLAEPGPLRVFAVRALGRAGVQAAPDLQKLLAERDKFTPAERADAVRSIKRATEDKNDLELSATRAAEALGPVLVTLAPLAKDAAWLASEDVGTLLELLAVMPPLEDARPPAPAEQALRELAALAAPPSAPAPVLRRTSWIRCGAARVLASDPRDPLLAACDLAPAAPESIGARAAIDVLGRADIVGPRLTFFREAMEKGSVRAQETALELLAEHGEVPDTARLLATALGSKHAGVVKVAADVLVNQPVLGYSEEVRKAVRAALTEEEQENGGKPVKPSKRSKPSKPKKPPPLPPGVKPEKAVEDAIVGALGRPDVLEDLEVAASLVKAAGALRLAAARSALESLCGSAFPVARDEAAATLSLLDAKDVTCAAPKQTPELPPELADIPTVEFTIKMRTDAGEVTLVIDPTLAPSAAARVRALAKSGYYKDKVVHRVVPGFVTQFGAPEGDGYGGPAGLLPLRCETSPVAFDAAGLVGVALSGRDTGSSQLYVTHAMTPHLEGKYALIGRATGPWAAFVDGDRIESFELVAAP